MSTRETTEERLLRVEGEVSAWRHNMRRALKAMVVVSLLFVLGFAATGWQINRAFDNLEQERLSRIGGQSSINAFLCQRIDSVGNGVAALVRVSLRNSPPPAQLDPAQRLAYERFVSYAEEQERPPRCRQVALQLAILTGADPNDVVITPLHLHRSEP